MLKRGSWAKSSFFLFAALMATCLFSFSCLEQDDSDPTKPDDDGGTKPNVTRSLVLPDGQAWTDAYMYPRGMRAGVIYMETGVFYGITDENSTGWYIEGRGTYTVSGNRITYGTGHSNTYRISENGDTLVFDGVYALVRTTGIVLGSAPDVDPDPDPDPDIPDPNEGATGAPIRGDNGYILIRSFAELRRIGHDTAYRLNYNYELFGDIDASASRTLNDGEGFLPIGGSSDFTGVFDGKGYTIKNLYMFRPLSRAGLFGRNRGIIRNLNVDSVNIVGGNNVGALAAVNWGSINDCSANSGTVTGTSYVGGLVGSADGQIIRSSSSNTVSGTSYVGGLMGSGGGTVTHNYATGNVKGTSYVGGFVGTGGGGITLCYSTGNVDGAGGTRIGGFAGQNNGALTRCYSTGNVVGNSTVGGFVGYQVNSFLQCYSTGQVSSPILGNNVGGFVGYRSGGSTTECYWNIETAGLNTDPSTCSFCKTTEEMKQQSTFTGWDFNVFWSIDEGVSYPYLKMLGPTK